MVNSERIEYADCIRVYIKVISAVVIATLGLFLSIIFLPESSSIQAQGNTSINAMVLSESLITKPCEVSKTITTVVAMQGWHGQVNHLLPPPYDSADIEVIANQIALAQTLCVTALVLDWYGPKSNLPNDLDRDHIDLVFRNMLTQAQGTDVHVALMYDENTITQAKQITTPEIITQQVLSDLLYAESKSYFSHPNYWKIDGQPVLFIFPYKAIDEKIDWNTILPQLNTEVKLITMWGEDLKYQHYINEIDGFYGWVQVTNPMTYLDKFYTTMVQTYPNKLAFGGVWPGFDDTLAAWGTGRYVSRACGRTWLDTWAKVEEHQESFALISTLNDYEEGTDIEQGIVKLTVSSDSSILPGGTTALTAFMADCPGVNYNWDFGDGTKGTGRTTLHTYSRLGNYLVTITTNYMPIDAPGTTQTLTASTLIKVSCTGWQEDFNPLDLDQWIQPTTKWMDTK